LRDLCDEISVKTNYMPSKGGGPLHILDTRMGKTNRAKETKLEPAGGGKDTKVPNQGEEGGRSAYRLLRLERNTTQEGRTSGSTRFPLNLFSPEGLVLSVREKELGTDRKEGEIFSTSGGIKHKRLKTTRKFSSKRKKAPLVGEKERLGKVL